LWTPTDDPVVARYPFFGVNNQSLGVKPRGLT
jgi:hypothetical protein